MVSDEKRGIFRVLDIGLPKKLGPRQARKSDRKVVKAIPRYIGSKLKRCLHEVGFNSCGT
jgi:hypothetical protein